MANFKHLCETFPDENCMLATQEIPTEASNIVYLNITTRMEIVSIYLFAQQVSCENFA